MVKVEPTLQLLRSDEACIRALEREQENTETALRVLVKNSGNTANATTYRRWIAATLNPESVSHPRIQDFLGTLQSFEACTPKIPGQGYFIFPEIFGVHVNSLFTP